MSGHIVNDFKDLRNLIGEITKADPAKTTRQQNEKKMGIHKEDEAQAIDDKKPKDKKYHAGEEEIKRAYLNLGRAAQGSLEYQRKLLQKELSKMGFKTYSQFAFDAIFKFENVQQAKREQEFKDTASQFQVESALSDMRNIVKTKGARKINGIMVDMFTASVITQAYDKVNDANKKKMEGANLQTLVKLAHKIMGMREELGLDESKIGDLLIDIQMGATAKELARDHDISIASAKNFLSQYYGNKKTRKAPGLKKEYVVLDTGLEKALKKFKVKFSKDLKNIDESGMKRLFQDLEDGASAQQISKKYGIDMKTAKSFVDDYKKVSKAPRLRAAENDPMKEGKYLRYSDLLLKKSRLIDKEGPNSPAVKNIDKEIGKEMRKLGIKEENLQEGTWTVPDSRPKLDALQKQFLSRPIKATEKNARTLLASIYNFFGDDSFYDDVEAFFDKPDPSKDLRDVIISNLSDWGVKFANYKITHAPESWVNSDEKAKPGLMKKFEDMTTEKTVKRGSGRVKKPKGKMIPLTMSKEDKLKEQKEHAQESPFKLKSQQYPRAIAINTDGFGNRHATVEDIIAACDSFGMILDKELQVEQIQKQLGKKGFISYKNTELEDVFEERETQRIILALESNVEEQGPIEYTKNEITEAYIMGEEIEFVKPDGLKTAGPVLKKSGNTFNVKDKFTGKSYTYKYIEEEKVKTFTEVINEVSIGDAGIRKDFPNVWAQKDKRLNNILMALVNLHGYVDNLKAYKKDKKKFVDSLKKIGKNDASLKKAGLTRRNIGEDIQEGRFSKQLIKQAGGIAFDKRYYMGNMSGAVKAIEKLKKGLSDDPKVREMLRIANESNETTDYTNWLPEGGDKEAYQKFFNKALKKFGVSSPDELEGEKKKEFFDYVDKNWKGDHEEKEVNTSDSRIDGRRKNFKEKMRKLGYIKGN